MSSGLQAILNDPKYHDYLAILKGARNGFVYGVKIRFPHALLMSILFGRGDWKSRLRHIIKATRTHATSLATFVTIYKLILLIQRRANGGKEKKADSFIAGLIGGYFVFGNRNAINEQIVLYVASRVLASFIPRASDAKIIMTPDGIRPIPPNSRLFTIFASLAWGGALWMFTHHGESLQPGMWSSMVYLYRDSEKWNSLRTLLWHNK